MNSSGALDEQLISEVQMHTVIYNRQKYFMNHGSPVKYESKEQAWIHVAQKLGTDDTFSLLVESCKKRWKYLRERYVQQRKQQTDTPCYEHLSRPYLEKMTFLDDHIMPRKSYRNSSNFLSSGNNNSTFGELVDSSRSNGSVSSAPFSSYHDNYNVVKTDPDQVFQNFPGTSEHHPHQTFPLGNQHQQPSQQVPQEPMQPLVPEYREGANNIPSSSSSLKSPLSSPPVPESNDSSRVKRPRLEHPRDHIDEEGDSSNNDELQVRNANQSRYAHAHRRNSTYPNNFLYSLYQQFPANGQVRGTEQLFGELVTTELLKMSREKKKLAQKRILEVLFFDD